MRREQVPKDEMCKVAGAPQHMGTWRPRAGCSVFSKGRKKNLEGFGKSSAMA